MSEQINNQTWISSGGHDWLWGSVNRTQKTLGAAGVRGEAMITTHVGGQQVIIRGILKAADAASLNAIEGQISALLVAGTAVIWEDDMGRSGLSLVILDYRRSGTREFKVGGGAVWQRYEIQAMELDGGVTI